MSEINNDALLGDLFGGTTEEILKNDATPSQFPKIETSGMYPVKITMAKQIDSKSSGAKDIVIEMETEDGAKLYWKAGWYIGSDGTIKDSKGNIKFQAEALAWINYLFTGEKNKLPVLEPATIKELEWKGGSPSEVTATRNICKSLIGKFAKVQVVRIRSNRQVNSGNKDDKGYDIWVDGPEEKFTNEVRRFYDAATNQTAAEKATGTPSSKFATDEEYIRKTPILDKFKTVEVAVNSASGSAPVNGFGSAPVNGFGA